MLALLILWWPNIVECRAEVYLYQCPLFAAQKIELLCFLTCTQFEFQFCTCVKKTMRYLCIFCNLTGLQLKLRTSTLCKWKKVRAYSDFWELLTRSVGTIKRTAYWFDKDLYKVHKSSLVKEKSSLYKDLIQSNGLSCWVFAVKKAWKDLFPVNPYVS